MKGRGYLTISAITHFVVASLLFFLWPRFSQVKRFEIILQPSLPQTEKSSQNENSESLLQSVGSFQGMSQSFFNAKPVSVPDAPPILQHVDENVFTDENTVYLPSLDDLVMTDKMTITTFTPNLEIPSQTPIHSPSSNASMAEIFWIEGEEYFADSFSKNDFSQLLLKSQVTIEVNMKVEESGIVSNIIKTVTGDHEIDQQIDRFLAQMLFRPSNSSYTVRFVIKLIPGAIFQ